MADNLTAEEKARAKRIKEINAGIVELDKPDNDLKTYLEAKNYEPLDRGGPSNSVKALADLKFSMDANGNAVADISHLRKAILSDLLRTLDPAARANPRLNPDLSDEEFSKGAKGILGGGKGINEGTEKQFKTIEREVTRLINERFMPRLVGVTPLNSIPDLTVDEFKKSGNIGKVGNFFLRADPYEITEHEKYLDLPLIKQNDISKEANSSKMIIHSSEIKQLKSFGYDVAKQQGASIAPVGPIKYLVEETTLPKSPTPVTVAKGPENDIEKVRGA